MECERGAQIQCHLMRMPFVLAELPAGKLCLLAHLVHGKLPPVTQICQLLRELPNPLLAIYPDNPAEAQLVIRGIAYLITACSGDHCPDASHKFQQVREALAQMADAAAADLIYETILQRNGDICSAARDQLQHYPAPRWLALQPERSQWEQAIQMARAQIQDQLVDPLGGAMQFRQQLTQ